MKTVRFQFGGFSFVSILSWYFSLWFFSFFGFRFAAFSNAILMTFFFSWQIDFLSSSFLYECKAHPLKKNENRFVFNNHMCSIQLMAVLHIDAKRLLLIVFFSSAGAIYMHTLTQKKANEKGIKKMKTNKKVSSQPKIKPNVNMGLTKWL